MEQYYYNHMNKAQQAAYHSILSGVKNLADEFQIPALEGEELYNVFFQMRLDHPEIFWVSSYKYRYYKDSPNLIFIPEYLFDKKKICEHQKAMTARVEKLIRPAQKLSEWEKEKYVHDFICESSSRLLWIHRSLSLSRALVASSRIRIGGFFRNTRAMEILCF